MNTQKELDAIRKQISAARTRVEEIEDVAVYEGPRIAEFETLIEGAKARERAEAARLVDTAMARANAEILAGARGVISGLAAAWAVSQDQRDLPYVSNGTETPFGNALVAISELVESIADARTVRPKGATFGDTRVWGYVVRTPRDTPSPDRAEPDVAPLAQPTAKSKSSTALAADLESFKRECQERSSERQRLLTEIERLRSRRGALLSGNAPIADAAESATTTTIPDAAAATATVEAGSDHPGAAPAAQRVVGWIGGQS